MSNEWSLHDEILKATNNWPWLALFCVIGVLLGFVIAVAWPSPFRATKELYVGLNIYNSIDKPNINEIAGLQVVNANDFKNWQMASLNNLILMDSIIDETLLRLQEIDPFWRSVSRTDLTPTLHVYWRNAGKWRLVAENRDPKRAIEAVEVWQDVVVQRVDMAVLEAQQALVLEFQLRSLADERAHYLVEIKNCEHIKRILLDWVDQLEKRAPVSAIDPSEHWQIWRMAVMLNPDSNWHPLLDQFPAVDSPARDYIEWIRKTAAVIETESLLYGQKMIELKKQEEQAAVLFSKASQKSLGLSATLDVDKITGSPTQITITRPTGQLMLTGSLLGLIFGLILLLIQIGVRGRAR